MTGHPLAEMADALDAAADRIDQAIEERAYVTPEVAADAERDSIRLRRTARVLRALHPDIARVAAALADGLDLRGCYSAQMGKLGNLLVLDLCNEMYRSVVVTNDGWEGFMVGTHPTAQAAVDAAVEALGGDPCP